MLRVGITGFGFMGQTHYKCWKAVEGAEVVAVCDVNPNIEEDTKRAVGNIGDTEEAVDFSSLRLYTDFEEMLKSAELDAVSITLPTSLHADFSVRALAAGVNVFCEKPMALNVEDCERMIAEAKRSGKVLQIGHCVRFWPEYAKAKQIVDSGEYGRVIAAMFQRLGAAPTWSIDNWFLDEKRSGGMALDLHIHDTDFVQYLFGVPRSVCSFGAKGPGGSLLHIVTQYLYDDDKVVTAEGGWAMMPTFGFEMSFNIVLAKATLVYDLTREPAFRVCPAEGEAFTPLEQSRDSVRIVAAEKESARKMEKVTIR
jgi:predicted dehydrogenase